MNLKKTLLGLLILTVLAGTVSAKAKKSESTKLNIVTTIFPEYDWTREILGDNINNVELTLLIGNGVDLHSYQPSIKDIAKVSNADIFVYVGGESDKWVKDALKNAKNKDMKVISLMDVLEGKVYEEEIKEGMQAEEEEEEEGEEEEIEYDEHVWLSLRFAKILSTEIANALCEKDSANAAKYRANLSAYIAKLDNLDSKYEAAVKKAAKKTVLFGDRFPFRYLIEDYGLDYFAAFVGCSAETEASFETVVFLANKLNELNLNSVLQIESGNGKIARTIIQNSNNKNAKILTLDSLQSTTSKQAEKGTTYLGVMENNLKVLEEALQ